MEGPTPSSALGYAGLSAHIGVVLLATNPELWLCYDWAAMAVGGVGALTAVSSGLIAHTCADRKGAIAYATSATLGQIFVVLSLGYTDAALALCLGR
jgi:NAD(P)H-quinone oxidoreductase subunit 5